MTTIQVGSQHTPGKWVSGIYHVDALNQDHFGVGPASNKHKIIALTGLVGQPTDWESEANAQLIAAVPDLYEACRYLLDHWGENLTESARQILAAVNKAEGGGE
jgi:hypothetical protein